MDWDHTSANGLDLRDTHDGNPLSTDLGLVMRVQRAGDIVISRPLFLIREWAMEVWDNIPLSEWMTF
ncbi:hypothetical protein [Microbispora sp. NBRC 16548]|uniref:hypothetical protein n=1 Tax=Microbispora sp. NBRC 16548 TaxID=3030994 RepID=UPI00160F1A1B|nr:hypothetical protein [Microbispora sp. NBRC 16548]